MDILDIIIIALHAIACGVGLLQKPLPQTPIISGPLAALFSGILYLIISDGGPGGGLGTHGQWYLIVSVMSVGLVPAITLGLAFWTGRFLRTFLR